MTARRDSRSSAALGSGPGLCWRPQADNAASPDHRPLLRLWTEAYARSLAEPDGAWSGFARASVGDWLSVLATAQPVDARDTQAGEAQRTIVLAGLRGAMLDLLATGGQRRVTAAVDQQLALLA